MLWREGEPGEGVPGRPIRAYARLRERAIRVL
jgi:hypothetical protein